MFGRFVLSVPFVRSQYLLDLYYLLSTCIYWIKDIVKKNLIYLNNILKSTRDLSPSPNPNPNLTQQKAHHCLCGCIGKAIWGYGWPEPRSYNMLGVEIVVRLFWRRLCTPPPDSWRCESHYPEERAICIRGDDQVGLSGHCPFHLSRIISFMQSPYSSLVKASTHCTNPRTISPQPCSRALQQSIAAEHCSRALQHSIAAQHDLRHVLQFEGTCICWPDMWDKTFPGAHRCCLKCADLLGKRCTYTNGQ